MTTHKIAHRILREPQEVMTLHRAGVWAVHQDAEVKVFAVSHTVTGLQAEPCNTLAEAIEIADALHEVYPDFAINAKWGKSPRFGDGELEGMRAIINDIAAKHDPESP